MYVGINMVNIGLCNIINTDYPVLVCIRFALNYQAHRRTDVLED